MTDPVRDLREAIRVHGRDLSAEVQDDLLAKAEVVIGRLEYWQTRAERFEAGIRSLVVWAGVQNRIDPRKAVEMLEALLDTSDNQEDATP